MRTGAWQQCHRVTGKINGYLSGNDCVINYMYPEYSEMKILSLGICISWTPRPTIHYCNAVKSIGRYLTVRLLVSICVWIVTCCQGEKSCQDAEKLSQVKSFKVVATLLYPNLFTGDQIYAESQNGELLEWVRSFQIILETLINFKPYKPNRKFYGRNS